MAFDPTDEADKKLVQDMIDEAVNGLKTKNAELLAEVKAAKKGQEIKPEQLDALETARDAAIERAEAAEKAAKDAVKAAEKAAKALESETGFTQKLLVENGLTSELVKAGVKPEFMPAVKSMLASAVKIVHEGDDRKALVGDKPLADHIAAWSQSDEGKHFVAAPGNGGGGAQGGGAAKGKSVNRIAFEAMDATARSAHISDGGTIVD